MGDKLTIQQAQAVNDRGGKLLVSAAAGSGKTKVLVDRLLKYLTDDKKPANLDDFLIITYTKAAASELRGKIAAKLTGEIAEHPENRHLQKQMQRLFLTKISTVHGFCGDILREYAYKLDLAPDFRVADENECREIRETVISDLLDNAYLHCAEDPDFRAFVDTQGLGRDDRLVPEIIMKVYDSARCHLDPDGWLEDCLKASQVDGMLDAGQTLWGKYLMEDLFSYLDCQIGIMRQCADAAVNCPGMEKVTENLRDTVYQMQTIRESTCWDEILERKAINYGRLTFPRKCDDPELPGKIKSARNACKKGLEKRLQSFADPSSQILLDLSQSAAGTRGLVALVKQFDRDYTAAKRSYRCLDFSDLEQRTLDLLLGNHRTGPTAAAQEISGRFREIMVDEYQDSNGVQDAIFTALTAEKQNAFMVGDVKQSIYQFRLADPGIFLDKYHRYLPVEEAVAMQGRKVLLSHNFRSGPEVIEAVNDVFQSCMSPEVGGLYYGEQEKLREGIAHMPFGNPGVELHALEIREDKYEEEASYVANRIQQLLQNKTMIRDGENLRPVQPDDIVILLRSPGSVGNYFQRALERIGVRCTSGGGNDLLQTEEIATLRSLLQTVYNPRLDIPLISTLASPVFGFTADDLAACRAKNKKTTVYDALREDSSEKTKDFLTILDTLRKEARMQTLTQLLETCFRMTRLDSIYSAMPDGEAKAANLQIFFQLAADFEMGNHRDLGQFLDHLDTLEEKGLISAGNATSGCVTIMSIHKSKGLEFPVVFLCGLSRTFNRESLRAQILCDKELGLGLSVVDKKQRIRYPSIAKRAIAVKMTEESLSEELRVLYVAMTRARDRLIMTYAADNLQGDLEDIALRMDFDGGKLLCRDVSCPGEWVLLTAMHRTEAGELFALGGRPAETHSSDYPWYITVSEAPEVQTDIKTEVSQFQKVPEHAEEILKNALAFRYPNIAATKAPSKQTATGIKGRIKDEEAAENTQKNKGFLRQWRRPTFLTDTTHGKTYGSAIHAALQFIRYDTCGSAAEVRSEIQRLVHEGFLSEEQGSLVNCEKIAAFFATPIGEKLRMGTDHLREFKFSILDSGDRYGEGLEEEYVLLQGVVDCALLESDGITVVDFKTDYVTEEGLSNLVERYRPQVDTYGDALSRIFQQPIKAKFLYLFHLDRLVAI